VSNFQIFISYARDDDLPPPNIPGGKGFVSHLHEQLAYEFKDFGPFRPTIWRDVSGIDPGDQFDPVIENAIAESSILLVVLSRNWMARPYCQRELDHFSDRWSTEGKFGIRQRIVVVGKRHVDPNDRPLPLQGQQGYLLYSREDAGSRAGEEHPFFSRGIVLDNRYYECLSDLASYLWRASTRMRMRPDAPPDDPSKVKEAPATATSQTESISAPNPATGAEKDSSAPAPADGSPSASATDPAAIPPNGRVVYLAKPADDMQWAYDRIAKELGGRGYAVVPDVKAEIPRDGAWADFIDKALSAAEVSIHLLGENPGYPPVGEEGIVKLQLARAAAKIPGASNGSDDAGFRRIIWAHRLVDHGTEQAAEVSERNPLDALAEFHRYLPTDKVEGGSLSKFVDFLIQHLAARRLPPALPPPPVDPDARIYFYHSLEDSEYAADIVEVFAKERVEAVLPALDGPPAELLNIHHKYLAECDAVVLCWAAASEVWVRAHSDELRDWHKLGRSKKFAYRGLIAGPPPGGRKKILMRVPPRKEIDIVLDLTAIPRPSSEALTPLLPGLQPDAPC
jgi:TIR domain